MNASLGEAVGQIYVQRHFPPAAKQQMSDLVENLRRAYGERVDALTWMSAETKVAAREKLQTFRPKIGYPDRWRDYAGLQVQAGDAYGNKKRFEIFDWNHDVERLGRRTDRDEWFMTPQTVNAYYNPVFNEVVFPAAILQPPFFDPNADPAVNYGAIGGVIGHEMGHGFDDQGAKSDAQGVLRDWWNANDVAAFTVLVNKLAAQYDTYTPLEGIQRQWPPHLRRKHWRQWRAAGLVLRLSIVAEWRGSADARWHERRSALLHGLGPGLAHADSRSSAAQSNPHRSTLAIAVSLQRHSAEHEFLVCRVQRAARRCALSGAG